MAGYITDLKDAILNYGGNTPFLDALPGGLWYGNLAPECAAQQGGAYALFQFESIVDDRTASELNDKALLQFHIFGDTADEVDTALAKCTESYNASIIDGKNISPGFQMRQNETFPAMRSQPVDRFRKYEGLIEFRLEFTKQFTII